MDRIFSHGTPSFPIGLAVNFVVNDAPVASNHAHTANHGAICNTFFHVGCQFSQTLSGKTFSLWFSYRQFARLRI